MGVHTSHRQVLIVEDEPSIRFGLRAVLESRGFQVAEAEDCRSARLALKRRRPDLVLLDYRLPDGNALDLLPRVTAAHPGVPAIVLTGHGSVDLAVQAMKGGAVDFLTKPVETASLLRLVDDALVGQDAQVENGKVAKKTGGAPFDPFVGSSSAIRSLARDAIRVCRSDYPILLLGETGSGKGVLARWLHQQSNRASASLTELNCAGLSRELLESELFGHGKGAFTGATAVKPGLLEATDGGTLFLDEVGDMDPMVQPKLLKVVEEQSFRRLGELRTRTVDLRFIAATHHRITDKVGRGEFRSDLYYRLSAFTLSLPSLRDRPEDLPALAQAILTSLTDAASPLAISEGALERLREHHWPGNIRELRNVLQRASVFAEEGEIRRAHLRFDCLAQEVQHRSSVYSGSLEDAQRQIIEAALRRNDGNVSAAAEQLGLGRSTLYEKIKRYDLDPEVMRSATL